MATTYVILDDTPNSHVLLTKQLQKRIASDDKIVSLYPWNVEAPRVDHLVVPVKVFSDVLRELQKERGDMLLFLDVEVNPIHVQDDFANGAIPAGYASLLNPYDPRVAIFVHTKGNAQTVAGDIRKACDQPEKALCVGFSPLGGLDARRDRTDQAAAEIVQSALKHFAGNSLERLWRHSLHPERWFGDVSPEHPMKHEPADAWIVRKQAETPGQEQGGYDALLRSAFGIHLPDSWFNTEESFTTFHRNLKHLCGARYCGGMENGAKNLTVGAVFLIAFMAYHATRKSLGHFAIESWVDWPKSIAKFLLLQEQDDARTTALTLFDLFVNLFSAQPMPLNSTEAPQSEVTGVAPYKAGGRFTVHFNWTANAALAPELRSRFGLAQHWSTKDFAKVPRSTESFMRLSRCLNIQKGGFGHPGRIYMDHNTLYVLGA